MAGGGRQPPKQGHRNVPAGPTDPAPTAPAGASSAQSCVGPIRAQAGCRKNPTAKELARFKCNDCDANVVTIGEFYMCPNLRQSGKASLGSVWMIIFASVAWKHDSGAE
jgi:hypothetical protein